MGFIFGGTDSLVSRIIFTLVGLAGLWTISVLFKKIVPADSVVTGITNKNHGGFNRRDFYFGLSVLYVLCFFLNIIKTVTPAASKTAAPI